MSNRNISFDIYKEYFEKEDVSQWVEFFSKTRGFKESILVQTHKCPLLFMGLHIFEIKLC